MTGDWLNGDSPSSESIPPIEREFSGVKAQSLRAMNLSLVLKHILTAPSVISRATISAHTGLTRATASRLVDELINAGLVLELSPTLDATRGRPAIRLAPRPDAVVALGLELNVSSMDARLIDLTGDVLAEGSSPNPAGPLTPDDTMQRLADLGQQVLDKGRPAGSVFLGSGLALPGLISPQALNRAPNLGWHDLPLARLLNPLAPLAPHIVANEADLAAYAVAHPLPGVPSGPASFIYVSGEVGVGAGLVTHHMQLAGTQGWSGEIGHICVDPRGPVCSCGATGCLEAYLGRNALASRANLPLDTPPRDIVARANNGDAQAQKALHDGGIALGRALAAVINVIDIPHVILGGTIADVADSIMEPAMTEISQRVLQSQWTTPSVDVRENSSTLAVTGAAHRVLQRLVDDPIVWTDELRAQ